MLISHQLVSGRPTITHQGPANKNGTLLEDLHLERGVEICNTKFQKRRGKPGHIFRV